MINFRSLTQVIADEVRNEEAEDYAFWRGIPSSGPAKSVALLDSTNPAHNKYRVLHRAAVEDFSAALRALEDQTRPPPIPVALPDWLQASSTPWRYGAIGNEWRFLGFPDRQTLARDLVRLRGAHGNVTPHAQKLIDYYSYVSQEQIDTAVAWEPIDESKFFDCFLNELDGRLVIKQKRRKRQLALTIRAVDAELTLEAEFKKGILLYDILGFCPGVITFASYEQWLSLGLSEWDRLDETSLLSAGKTLAEIVRRVSDWRAAA